MLISPGAWTMARVWVEDFKRDRLIAALWSLIIIANSRLYGLLIDFRASWSSFKLIGRWSLPGYIYIYKMRNEDLGKIFGRESFASFLGRIRRIAGSRKDGLIRHIRYWERRKGLLKRDCPILLRIWGYVD